MDEEHFSKAIIEVLAKRAANICSNPDCGAITSGPADEANRSVVIGEAAHIYGARPGSARYRDSMAAAERGDITNAIWLCRNCHKAIDADPNGYPAELIFEWRRQHEDEISKRLGKTSDFLREKVIARQVHEFSSCSYLAQQIVIDKPECWEFKLTLELFRTQVQPVLVRWEALEKGLYTKPAIVVKVDDMSDWLHSRMDEAKRLIHALAGLASSELTNSWGPPGQSGNPSEILRVCDLFREFVNQVIQWEETVRFSSVPAEFVELQGLLAGTTGHFLRQITRITDEIHAIIDPAEPNRMREVSLVLDLPDGWSEKCNSALERAWKNVAANRRSF